MNFLETYNEEKSKLIYGTDYIDFVFGDYLLFIPLTRISPAALKFIHPSNCVIQCSSFHKCYSNIYYDTYVYEHYMNRYEQKAFLINTKDIFKKYKSRMSFISFYFKFENGSIILGDEMHDGGNYYYNLNKLHKTKYWKGEGRSGIEEEFYKNKLIDILLLTVNQMLKSLGYKFDYKPQKK